MMLGGGGGGGGGGACLNEGTKKFQGGNLPWMMP